jgi:hypothetical protein
MRRPLGDGGVETIRLESFVRSVEALLLKSTDGITSWDPRSRSDMASTASDASTATHSILEGNT